MMNYFHNIEHREEISKSSLSWWIPSIFCVIPLILIFILSPESNGIYILAGQLGIVFAAVSIIFPRIWAFSTIMMLPLYLISRDTEINPMEVAVYGYILSGLFIWFVNMLLIKRERIAKNWGDFFLLLFLGFSAVNIIIAILNDVEIFSWFKEYSLYCLYLLYFPYRYYLKSEQDRKIFIILLSISLILVSSYQLYHFRTVMLLATFAYELQSTLRINLTIIAFGGILGLIGMFVYKPVLMKITLFILTILSFGIVITSFARTTWIIEMFIVLLIFFILNRKQKIVASTISVLSFLLLIAFLMSSFTYFGVYVSLINKKFLSTGAGKKDVSVMARVVEYEAVWKSIKENPISGNGFAKKFAHKNLISPDKSTLRKSYTHNSFYQLIYNVGLPSTILMCLFLAYYFYFSIAESFFNKSRDTVKKKFIPFIVFSGFVIALSHSMVSPQLLAKETAILIVVCCYLSDNIINDRKNTRNNTTKQAIIGA